MFPRIPPLGRLSICHRFGLARYQTYQDSVNVYMLLSYVPGGELFSHLRRAGRFTPDVTRFYLSSIILAVACECSLSSISPPMPVPSFSPSWTDVGRSLRFGARVELRRIDSDFGSPSRLPACLGCRPPLSRHHLPRPQARKPPPRSRRVPQVRSASFLANNNLLF